MAGAGEWLLRSYREEDLQRLHEIDCLCFPPGIAYSRAELRFYLSHRDAVSRVAELDGAIVGFAVGRILGRRAAHVVTLDVVPEARRRGIGSALMKTLHEEFARHGAAVSILEVSVENRAALAFYAGMGYRREALLPGYYGGLLDAYRMVCSLKR